MATDPVSAVPILMAFRGPDRQRRLTVLFRLLLLVPHLVVLALVGIAGAVITVLAWFGALVTGRLPDFAVEFLLGYLRWQSRVVAYECLLTDRYPPFSFAADDTYPVELVAHPGRLNRWAVLFRVILIAPAWVVFTVVQYGAFSIVAFVTWWIVLISGRMPPSLFQAYAAAVRYQFRVAGYFVMLTSEWPTGLFGDKGIGAYGLYPPFGNYGAQPPYGQPPQPQPQRWSAPYAPPPPAQPQPWIAPPPPPPAAPLRPGVTITFGGPSYLWGYNDDRSVCGIWSTTNPAAPPQTWPIAEQGEAWTRFRELEAAAAAFSERPPPPTAPTPGQWETGGSVTAGAMADAARWQLTLSPAARRLVVLFIVLGSVGSIAASLLNLALSHPFQNFTAVIQIEGNDQTLDSAVQSYETEAKTCHDLACIQPKDAKVGTAFATFAGELRSISVSSTAAPDKARLLAETVHVQRVFQALADAPDVTRYNEIFQGNGPILTVFSQDYQRFVRKLEGAF